jgi:signal transduction histidine kinase
MAEHRQHPRELDVTLPRWDETGRTRHRRLERQLHDGPALRLAALSLRLGLCQHRAPRDDEVLQQCLAAIQEELHAVVQELRDVASEIYPPLLDTAGLGPALAAFAERQGVPMTVHASGERLDASAEATAYFAVAERLSALAGRCSSATLNVRRSGDELVVRLTAELARGTAEEAEPVTSDQDSARDVMTVRVPCGS